MKIAELFVDLKVKGGKEASDALKGLKLELGGIADVLGVIGISKAVDGIISGVRAFKDMTAASNQTGHALEKFQTLTGMSADRLQRWQYLALMSGESAEDMTSSLQNAQNAISKMVLGQGPPGGLGALVAHGFDVKQSRNLEYVAEFMRKYAQETKGTPEAQSIMDSMGFSRNMQYALMTSNVDLNKVGGNHRYSDGQAKSLDKMKVGWDSLGDEVAHAIGQVNAKFGPDLLKDVTMLTHSLIDLFKALADLADSLGLVKAIGSATAGVVDNVKSLTAAAKDASKGHYEAAGGILADRAGKDLTGIASFMSHIMPPLSGMANKTTTNYLNPTFNIHEAHDPKKTAQAVKEHMSNMLNTAARQIPVGSK